MWMAANRPPKPLTTVSPSKYKRDQLRYPSNLTDEEWPHVAPVIAPAKHGGRKRKVDCREIANGSMDGLSTRCQWRTVQKDLPPRSTLYDYFDLWTYDGTLANIHPALDVKCREAMEREASPTACIIELERQGRGTLRQSHGGLDRPARRSLSLGRSQTGPEGCGQKNQGQETARSRRTFRPPAACDRTSSFYSRPPLRRSAGGVLVLSTLFGMYPFLQKLFADGGTQGPVFHKALAEALAHLKIAIGKRSDQAKGFEVVPKRRVADGSARSP